MDGRPAADAPCGRHGTRTSCLATPPRRWFRAAPNATGGGAPAARIFSTRRACSRRRWRPVAAIAADRPTPSSRAYCSLPPTTTTTTTKFPQSALAAFLPALLHLSWHRRRCQAANLPFFIKEHDLMQPSERSGIIIALCGFALLSVGDAVIKTMAGEFSPLGVAAMRFALGAAGLSALL